NRLCDEWPACSGGLRSAPAVLNHDRMEFRSEPAARTALDTVPGLVWRPCGRGELPAGAGSYAACERHDASPERTSPADLREYWDAPRSAPDEDTLVGWNSSGDIVAVAWSGCRRGVTAERGVHLGGAVHPVHRGEGLGSAVLQWELAHGAAWDNATRGAEHGPLVMRLWAPVDQADVRDLALRNGLVAERYFYEMSRRLDTPVAVSSAAGVRLVD